MIKVDMNLSDEQKRAVTATEGAVLVFAGAGSGKTRVITRRIAYLIDSLGVSPENILAVTFTNKAAREMRERVAGILDSETLTKSLTICTFHALGLGILKNEFKKIGYPPNFTIYSPYEQCEIMKKVMYDEKISSDRFSPQAVVSIVSKMKNNPELAENPSFLLANLTNGVAKRVFKPYCEAMRVRAALDFDDLIALTVKLLKEDEEIRSKYSSKYKYIMVDEYQDTNAAQFELVKLLSSIHKNICVVGDDDQSIYSWRGAKVENILNFNRDFEDVTVVKLEENYRSVSEIVETAGNLIANNVKRSPKKCFASKKGGAGEGVRIVELQDEKEEAEFVAKEILNWKSMGEKLNNIAVIVRANHQTRLFELTFSRFGLPFVIVGGSKFFENKEIKDILAYIKILLNPQDEINLRRIINYPARGIGGGSVDKVFNVAESMKIIPMELFKDFYLYKSLFSAEQVKSLGGFADLISELEEKFNSADPAVFTSFLIKRTTLEAEVKKSAESEEEASVKLGNISAFLDAVVSDPKFCDYKNARAFFAYFVNSISLTGSGEEESQAGKITIITAHSAKGLEFDKVFIPGFFQGGFPNHLAIEEQNVDEERRLAYVAFTRAKKLLTVTDPQNISFKGSIRKTEPSIFIKEAGIKSESHEDIPANPLDALQAILEKLKQS